VVVDNQIGFTTDPRDARSTKYCTHVAKMLQIPIFHVNGEDPEAVAQVIQLALDYRREFKRDVVVDMYSYRRRGHNETDEPAFTQPLLYRQIRQRESVRHGYLEHLKKLGHVTDEMAEKLATDRREILECFLNEAREDIQDYEASWSARPKVLSKVWSKYSGGAESEVPDVATGIPAARASELLRAQSEVPADFTPHAKTQRLLGLRNEMAVGAKPLDWAAAEALAMASLVTDGYRVRLSGQDSQRGTFSHRHAVLHDFETGERYTPLQNLSRDQAPCEIINSPLSETGVMGFEYGFSLAYPDGLVAWEAQFGDFFNVAQPIVDQFIASGERKWKMLSGLVLLLPHGFEGMGPEHSSARIERFLGLAARDNLQIVYPTLPAQLFHVLRRQVLRPWRKPLVVFTPKSLLRHPAVVSNLEDLAEGTGFLRLLPDPREVAPGRVHEVLLCSGKVYFDLEAERREQGRDDLVIHRLEQLYLFPEEAVAAQLDPLGPQVKVRWVQEEPANMGAWPYLRYRYGNRLLGRWDIDAVCRPESASVATGSSASHKLELRNLLDQVFDIEPTTRNESRGDD
jgi:2-oxoglutarate dehydrogenase E1 component